MELPAEIMIICASETTLKRKSWKTQTVYVIHSCILDVFRMCNGADVDKGFCFWVAVNSFKGRPFRTCQLQGTVIELSETVRVAIYSDFCGHPCEISTVYIFASKAALSYRSSPILDSARSTSTSFPFHVHYNLLLDCFC